MRSGRFLLGLFVLILWSACGVKGQGTFIFDQQSSTDETPPPLNAGGPRIPGYPDYGFGQSFTPSLSSVGFIRLLLSDANTSDSIGAVVYLNLRSSVSGSIIGTSSSVTMLNGFSGAENFFFSTPVPTTPGIPYYFEAVEQTGGPWNMFGIGDTYPGGSAYNAGSPQNGDYWFREGIVVPEPSSAAFMLLGVLGCLFARRTSRS